MLASINLKLVIKDEKCNLQNTQYGDDNSLYYDVIGDDQCTST